MNETKQEGINRIETK